MSFWQVNNATYTLQTTAKIIYYKLAILTNRVYDKVQESLVKFWFFESNFTFCRKSLLFPCFLNVFGWFKIVFSNSVRVRRILCCLKSNDSVEGTVS